MEALPSDTAIIRNCCVWQEETRVLQRLIQASFIVSPSMYWYTYICCPRKLTCQLVTCMLYSCFTWSLGIWTYFRHSRSAKTDLLTLIMHRGIPQVYRITRPSLDYTKHGTRRSTNFSPPPPPPHTHPQPLPFFI